MDVASHGGPNIDAQIESGPPVSFKRLNNGIGGI